MQQPINGGCLCGAIRYNIQFFDDSHSLPQPTTCQCTQCRKNSGALVAYFITVASSNVTGSTPGSYSATPGFVRTFCKKCGS
ncbi:Mss4-like protein [Mucidula mucida]|nr:Mss4-like protein [Mucidula mucida]